ncbi:MAG: ribosome maturation factor RimM [Firmicutes bacterium]|nr:ribosome maturation factor RimM [Bacillota bacterium]
MSGDPGKLIAIAYILGPYGTRGHVKIQSLTDAPRRFVPGLEVVVDPPHAGSEVPSRCRIEGVLERDRGPAVKLSGVDDRDAAEALRGKYLKVEKSAVAPLPEGRHYVFEIIGLDVYSTGGELLGRVSDVLRTGANDVYVVTPRAGRKEILIPALKTVVKAIDLESRKMVVEPPEGLIEGGSA